MLQARKYVVSITCPEEPDGSLKCLRHLLTCFPLRPEPMVPYTALLALSMVNQSFGSHCNPSAPT